jgi:hypothetical protein
MLLRNNVNENNKIVKRIEQKIEHFDSQLEVVSGAMESKLL